MKSKLKSEFIARWQKKKNQNSFNFLVLDVNPNTGKKNIKTKLGDKDLHIMSNDFDISVSNECCNYLKKKPFKDWQKEHGINAYFTGVRMSEGGARELSARKRLLNGGKLCTATKGNTIIKMPIIDWTDEDVEEFIKRYNVPLSRAYTEYGMKRTGCMGCPYARELAQNLEVLYKYEPNRYKASMFWLKDVYIAQNVILPFDKDYERDRKEKWNNSYYKMRYEMIKKYRPEKLEKFNNVQTKIDDYF